MKSSLRRKLLEQKFYIFSHQNTSVQAKKYRILIEYFDHYSLTEKQLGNNRV